MKEVFQIGNIEIEVLDVVILMRDTNKVVVGAIIETQSGPSIRVTDACNTEIQNYMTLLGSQYIKSMVARNEEEAKIDLHRGLMEEATYREEGRRALYMKLVLDIQTLIRRLEHDGVVRCYLGVSEGLSMGQYVLEGEIKHTHYDIYREKSEIPKGQGVLEIGLGKKMVFSMGEIEKLLGF